MISANTAVVGAKRYPASVVVVGCARDCDRYLPGALHNALAIGNLFANRAFVFVENDSRDQTLTILQRFRDARSDTTILTLGDLDARYPLRTARLAHARNQYLEFMRNCALRSFDFLVVMDMDEINFFPIAVDQVAQAARLLESDANHAAAFANQPQCYYDMWALRQAKLSPGDVWEEALRFAIEHNVSDDVAYEATYRRRTFAIPETAPVVEVDSAFGGIGIYRMSQVLRHDYSGTRRLSLMIGAREHAFDCQVCEHVALHNAIRRGGGRLFILPSLVNARGVQFHLRPVPFRSLFVARDVAQFAPAEKLALPAEADPKIE
jgi:hypothetical protein